MLCFCRPRSDVSPYREVVMAMAFVGDTGSGITPAGLTVNHSDSLEMPDLHYALDTLM